MHYSHFFNRISNKNMDSDIAVLEIKTKSLDPHNDQFCGPGPGQVPRARRRSGKINVEYETNLESQEKLFWQESTSTRNGHCR